jgi:iron-sulfur cluster repair protein YtfE (RIC family)
VSEAQEDRDKAAKYPDGDVLHVLYEHHALIHELLGKVESSKGEERKSSFTRLATLLKAHEMAEEAVVRPVTAQTAGKQVVEARNEEENEADEVIVTLSELDVDSAEFEKEFAEFKESVTEHAESEEDEEFPTLDRGRSPQQRQEMGHQFLETFEAASANAE